MKNLFFTLALTSAMLVGGMAWTGTAEARPRGWYGGYGSYYPRYYGGYYPRYYSGYYPMYGRYYPRYYGGYYSGYYPRYYNYPYRYSYGPRAGIYLR